jgi:hypothetical protein
VDLSDETVRRDAEADYLEHDDDNYDYHCLQIDCYDNADYDEVTKELAD